MDAQQLKYFKNRDRNGLISLRGVGVIQITAANLTKESRKVCLFGKNKFRSDEVEIKNLTSFYQDDDNNLTMMKNYINAVGYVEIVLVRLQSTNVSQLTQILGYTVSDDKSGKTEAIITQSYFSAHQFQHSILDIPFGNKKLSRDVSIDFDLLAHSTLCLTMFLGNNKGDVRIKSESFYDKVKETYEAEHYTMMDKGKKRMLVLKD